MIDSDDSTRFLETHRWDLAKAHLDRADQSGNLIRGLLFAGAGAAIGFILHRNQNTLAWHLLPLLLMLIACGLIFWSWDQQKKKSPPQVRSSNDRATKGVPRIQTNEELYNRSNSGGHHWPRSFCRIDFVMSESVSSIVMPRGLGAPPLSGAKAASLATRRLSKGKL